MLFLLDGQRLNDPVFISGFIGTESIIDVDLIDRVEIIRGSSSALYGTNALFGVINIITNMKELKHMNWLSTASFLGIFPDRSPGIPSHFRML